MLAPDTVENRRKWESNFYDFHQLWLEDEGIKNLPEWIEKTKVYFERESKIVEHLFEKTIVSGKKYREFKINFEEYSETIQDFTIYAIDLNNRYKKVIGGS